MVPTSARRVISTPHAHTAGVSEEPKSWFMLLPLPLECLQPQACCLAPSPHVRPSDMYTLDLHSGHRPCRFTCTTPRAPAPACAACLSPQRLPGPPRCRGWRMRSPWSSCWPPSVPARSRLWLHWMLWTASCQTGAWTMPGPVCGPLAGPCRRCCATWGQAAPLLAALGRPRGQARQEGVCWTLPVRAGSGVGIYLFISCAPEAGLMLLRHLAPSALQSVHCHAVLLLETLQMAGRVEVCLQSLWF